MRKARLDALPATGGVVHGVERGVDATPSCLREQSGGRGAVECGHDECAGDVQRSGCEDLRRKLLGAERPIRPGQMEKRALTRSIDQYDGCRGGYRGIP